MLRTSMLGGLLCCAFSLIAFAETASADDVRYSGKSSQGQKVVLETNPRGAVEKFVIHFKAGCTSSDGIKSRQSFERPFRQADANGFRDGGKLSGGSQGIVGKARVHVTGKRTSETRFAGTFSVKVKYYDDGEVINTCQAQGVRWAVES